MYNAAHGAKKNCNCYLRNVHHFEHF